MMVSWEPKHAVATEINQLLKVAFVYLIKYCVGQTFSRYDTQQDAYEDNCESCWMALYAAPCFRYQMGADFWRRESVRVPTNGYYFTPAEYSAETVISAEYLPNLNAKYSIRPGVPTVRIAGRPSSIPSVSAEYLPNLNAKYSFRPSVPTVRIAGQPSSIPSVPAEHLPNLNANYSIRPGVPTVRIAVGRAAYRVSRPSTYLIWTQSTVFGLVFRRSG
jgi:hypothetical protein